MKKILLISPIFCAAFAVSHAALADRLEASPLAYGVNAIDFGHGTLAGMAVLGHRDNFNAHGFDVLTMYVKSQPVDPRLLDWQIVPVFENDQENKESLNLTVSGGADCMLHDFRLLRERGQNHLTLIVADRTMGDSYVEFMPVQFKYYEFHKNSEGDIGRPFYYFTLTKTQTSSKPYCDVEQAFIEELRISDYRKPSRPPSTVQRQAGSTR
jgi:hypothetical protein